MRGRDWMLLLGLSVLWGFSFFFAAIAVKAVPPLTLVLARVSLASLVLLLLVRALGLHLPQTRHDLGLFLVQSILNNVVPFTLMVYGQSKVASGLAAVLNATTPLFALLAARLIGGETMTLNRALGVTCGLAGVAVLVGPELRATDTASLLGMGSLLLAALFYGSSALWMRRLRHIDPIVSAASQLSVSSLILLPLAAAVDRFWLLPWPGLHVIGAVLGFALLSTALAYIVFFRISASAGPQNVMLVTLLVPVTATGLGVAFLGETLSLHQVFGALVIALGLVMTDGRALDALRRRLDHVRL